MIEYAPANYSDSQFVQLKYIFKNIKIGKFLKKYNNLLESTTGEKCLKNNKTL